MNDIERHFEMRSKRYDDVSTSWVRNEVILKTIKKYVQKTEKYDLKLLDVGAGTGIVSTFLLHNCDKNIDITALDISSAMLEKIKESKIRKCVSLAENMPFDDRSFDIVVSRQCLHYIQEIDTVVEEIKRVLVHKGTFILSQIVPYSEETKEYWSRIIEFRQPLRKHYFSKQEWIEAIKKHGFDVEECSQTYHIASINNWIIKYNVDDDSLVEQYRKYLLDAPSSYKEQYEVIELNRDIKSKSFWVTILFRKK